MTASLIKTRPTNRPSIVNGQIHQLIESTTLKEAKVDGHAETISVQNTSNESAVDRNGQTTADESTTLNEAAVERSVLRDDVGQVGLAGLSTVASSGETSTLQENNMSDNAQRDGAVSPNLEDNNVADLHREHKMPNKDARKLKLRARIAGMSWSVHAEMLPWSVHAEMLPWSVHANAAMECTNEAQSEVDSRQDVEMNNTRTDEMTEQDEVQRTVGGALPTVQMASVLDDPPQSHRPIVDGLHLGENRPSVDDHLSGENLPPPVSPRVEDVLAVLSDVVEASIKASLEQAEVVTTPQSLSITAPPSEDSSSCHDTPYAPSPVSSFVDTATPSNPVTDMSAGPSSPSSAVALGEIMDSGLTSLDITPALSPLTTFVTPESSALPSPVVPEDQSLPLQKEEDSTDPESEPATKSELPSVDASTVHSSLSQDIVQIANIAPTSFHSLPVQPVSVGISTPATAAVATAPRIQAVATPSVTFTPTRGRPKLTTSTPIRTPSSSVRTPSAPARTSSTPARTPSTPAHISSTLARTPSTPARTPSIAARTPTIAARTPSASSRSSSSSSRTSSSRSAQRVPSKAVTFLSSSQLVDRFAKIRNRWRKRGSLQTPFTLDRREMRRVAVHGGICDVRGFVQVRCSMSALRPFLSPRPSLHQTWLWRTRLARSLSGLALQLRQLQAVLRWDQLSVRPPRGPPIASTTNDIGHTITKELLARRDLDPDGLRSEYLLKVNRSGAGKQAVERSKPKPTVAPVTPQSSKARLSKSAANQMIASLIAEEESGAVTAPPEEDEVSESESEGQHWVDERHLPIWHMRQFTECLEKRRQQEAESNHQRRLQQQLEQQRQAKARAAELAAQRLADKKKRQSAVSVTTTVASASMTVTPVTQPQAVLSSTATPPVVLSAASALPAPPVMSAIPPAFPGLPTATIPLHTQDSAQTDGTQRMYLIQVPGQSNPMLVWLPHNATRAAITLPGHTVR